MTIRHQTSASVHGKTTGSGTRPPRGWIAADLAAVVLFSTLALLWSFPLLLHISTAIPGNGSGDNLAALWNFWWMRFAQQHHVPFFTTEHLFAPVGTSLALHTHIALPAWLGATALRGVPLVLTHNLLLLATLTANGVACYWLLRRLTSDWFGAVCGAIIFAGSPFIDGHLLGHFNLVSAWTLPLVCLATVEAARGSLRWTVTLGVLLGLTPYLDYYYALYALALSSVLLPLESRTIEVVQRPAEWSRRVSRWIAAFVCFDLIVVAIIAAVGETTRTFGPLHVRLALFNPLQVLWLLVALWAWMRWQPRVRVVAVTRARWTWTGVGVAAGIAIVLAAPVLVAVARLALAGDYVSQPVMWRSGPQGIDVATLLSGNPHSAWRAGALARQLTSRFAIDMIERSSWLGVIPVCLTVITWRGNATPLSRRWTWIAGCALVWALGPHLSLFGYNTGMILPEALLRYLPIVSNARIPGRAMVVVYLALGMLGALGMASLRRCGFRRTACWVVIACCVIDFTPAPIPLLALDRPGLYDRLRTQPEPGAVLEIPLGMRDGFGEHGSLDTTVQWYQTIHERPLVGGFVARLPPSTQRMYETDPLLSALLRASTRGAVGVDLPAATTVRQLLREHHIAFIVLDRAAASTPLVTAVQQLGLVPLGTHGARELFGLPPAE